MIEIGNFKIVKSVFDRGLLVYSRETGAVYIDVADPSEKEFLIAGKLHQEFDSRWGGGSFNLKRLKEVGHVKLPDDIYKVLWPIAGNQKYIYSSRILSEEIANIGRNEVLKAIRKIFNLFDQG